MFPARRAAVVAAVAVASVFGITHEGLRTVAYYDPKGIPTICVGRTQGVKIGDQATRDQCLQWLGEEMTKAIETADRCIPANVNLTPGQLAAFGDITYNVGPRPVCDTANSTMARKLKAGDVLGACNEFPKWDKICRAGVCVPLRGLTIRREHNRALCRGEIK